MCGVERFKTPEKNRSRPINYGPEKKKMMVLSDGQRAALQDKRSFAIKLNF